MERPFPVMCGVVERCLSLENFVTDFYFPQWHAWQVCQLSKELEGVSGKHGLIWHGMTQEWHVKCWVVSN